MDNTRKTQIFENATIPRAVVTLCIPTVISSLVMVIYNLADTWFVGLLNDPIQNAAVTFAAPVLLAFNAVNNLFGVGASSMMGRALGRKDTQTVRRSSAFGFWAAAVSGLLFSLLVFVFNDELLTLLGASGENVEATRDYLFWTVCMGAAPSILNVVLAYLVRTEGAVMHASIGTIGGCLLNIILDPFFVLPQFLDMGAAGAGLATFISVFCACIYFFVLLFLRRKTTFVCLNPLMAVPKKRIVTEIFAVGIPAAIQNLLNVTGMTVLNNFTAEFGSHAVAAMGISYKIYMIPMQTAWGISQGVNPFISYNYGSKNIDRAKEMVKFTAKIAVTFLFLVTIILQVFSKQLIGLFIDDEQIIYYGTRFLRGMSLAPVLHFIDFLGVGVFQSFGNGLLSLIFAILRKVVLEIPALIVLNKLFPLYGLAYAQFFAEFVLAIASVCTLKVLFAKTKKRFEQDAKEHELKIYK